MEGDPGWRVVGRSTGPQDAVDPRLVFGIDVPVMLLRMYKVFVQDRHMYK
jgi:hypothetical protein